VTGDNVEDFVPTTPSPPTTTPSASPNKSPSTSPTASPTETHVFDPNAINFCGKDYYDARDNCYKNKVCEGGLDQECPEGQTCFPGIENCDTPPPTIGPTTATPTYPMPTVSPTKTPTNNPTVRPTNLDDDFISGLNGGVLWTQSLILKFLVMSGLTFWALL